MKAKSKINLIPGAKVSMRESRDSKVQLTTEQQGKDSQLTRVERRRVLQWRSVRKRVYVRGPMEKWLDRELERKKQFMIRANTEIENTRSFKNKKFLFQPRNKLKWSMLLSNWWGIRKKSSFGTNARNSLLWFVQLLWQWTCKHENVIPAHDLNQLIKLFTWS